MSSGDDSPGPGGYLILAAIGVALFWFAISDWNQAPETPMSAGITSISPFRVIMFSALLLVLFTVLARRVVGDKVKVRPPVALIVLAVAAGTALEATGALRKAVIGTIGKVPGGPTRLQTHYRAIAEMEARGHAWFGSAQPLQFFLGDWRRYDNVFRYDVRRFSVRTDGARVLVRAWIECKDGGVLCDAGEAVANVSRSSADSVRDISIAMPTPNGRIWLKFAPGRNQWPVVAMTHVNLERDAEWQVSSGFPVGVAREMAPVPLAGFLGAWERQDQPREGDFTRLAVRQAGAQLAMRAWMRCGPKQECDLGEKSADAEGGSDGTARLVRSEFARENRQLTITLEPLAEGRLGAISLAAVLSYTTTRPDRRGNRHTYASGRNSSLNRTELQRAGAR